MSSQYILGIDIGGTHIRMGAVDETFKVHFFEKTKSQPILDTEAPLDRLCSLITEFEEKHSIKLSSVSIGFPSTIDAPRRKVISTPNIASLQNLDVVDFIENKLGLRTYINRDVNYLLLSDLNNLELNPTPSSVCGFYIGTGIGNTIMINNRLLIGKNGKAAELGHTHVIGFDGQCGCGGKGCVELLSGGLALARIQREYFKDTLIDDIFTMHADTEVIDKYIDDLAATVCNEIVIIDPELCLFGGGVIQMANFPKERFEKYIYKYARKPCEEGSISIVYVEDNPESGVQGAGIYAFKRINDSSYL